MIQIVGTVTRIETETVNPPSGESFESTTFVLVGDDGSTRFVRKARNFAGADPVVGEVVTLGVWISPYVSKKTDSLAFNVTAFRVVPAPALAAA